MVIQAEKSAGQNSAYRHLNMKGAFGNEGALLFFWARKLASIGMITAQSQGMELAQSIFLKGSRFVRFEQDSDTVSVRSRTGHAANEFSLHLSVLHDAPARLTQRALRLLPGVLFFVVMFVSASVGVLLNHDQSGKITCAIIAPLFFFASCAGFIRIRQSSYDLLVFYNRFNGQPAFNLFYQKPNPAAFDEFISALVNRIKQAQTDVILKQEASVPAQIEAFARLHKHGAITDDQFDTARRKLLETVATDSKRIGF